MPLQFQHLSNSHTSFVFSITFRYFIFAEADAMGARARNRESKSGGELLYFFHFFFHRVVIVVDARQAFSERAENCVHGIGGVRVTYYVRDSQRCHQVQKRHRIERIGVK